MRAEKPQKKGGSHTKPGRNEDANIVQRHLELQKLQDLPDPNCPKLHPRINRGPYRPPQRIPHRMVKPFEEALSSIGCQVFCGTVVEPWIKLVNHSPEVRYGEQTSAKMSLEGTQNEEKLASLEVFCFDLHIIKCQETDVVS